MLKELQRRRPSGVELVSDAAIPFIKDLDFAGAPFASPVMSLPVISGFVVTAFDQFFRNWEQAVKVEQVWPLLANLFLRHPGRRANGFLLEPLNLVGWSANCQLIVAPIRHLSPFRTFYGAP